MKPSAAQIQAEAEADIARIATAYYEELWADIAEQMGHVSWSQLPEDYRRRVSAAFRRMLQKDVIRVGKRPEVHEPIEGQTTIDEHLDPFLLEDRCDADD